MHGKHIRAGVAPGREIKFGAGSLGKLTARRGSDHPARRTDPLRFSPEQTRESCMKGPREIKRYVACNRARLKAVHWDDLMIIIKASRCKKWRKRHRQPRDGYRA